MAKGQLKNTNDIEVTNNFGKVVFSTKNSGTDSQRIYFNLTGRVVKNKPTVIGTLKVTSSVSNYIPRKPSILKKLSADGELNLSLISVTKNANDLNNSFLFSIIYTAKEITSEARKLKYTISSTNRNMIKSKVIPDTKKRIHKVDFGKSTISQNGERRKIVVEGDPGAEFSLAINKMVDNRYIACLDDNFYNDTSDNNVKIKNCVIDSSGKFIYYYKIKENISYEKYYMGIRTLNPAFKQDYFKYTPTSELAQWSEWWFNEYKQSPKRKFVLRATTTDHRYEVNEKQVIMRDHDNNGATPNVQVIDKFFSKPGSYKIVYNIYLVSGSRGSSVSSAGKTVNLAGDFTNYDTRNTSFTISNFVVDDAVPGDSGNDKARISFELNIKSINPSICSFNINEFITVT